MIYLQVEEAVIIINIAMHTFAGGGSCHCHAHICRWRKLWLPCTRLQVEEAVIADVSRSCESHAVFAHDEDGIGYTLTLDP